MKKTNLIITALVLAPALTTQTLGQRPQPAPKPGASEQQAPGIISQHVALKLERGGRIAATNHAGRTTITGWDRDTIEATARGDEGSSEPVEYRVSGEPPRALISFSVPASGARGRHRDVDLDLKVPRYTQIESVEGRNGDIDVMGVEGAISISSVHGTVTLISVGPSKVGLQNGDIVARGVKGSFQAKLLSGDTIVENIAGEVEVASANGDIRIVNADGNVRAHSAAGDVHVECAKGRAEASTASGDVVLIGVAGDAEATTASGDVSFKGTIRAGGRYVLKSVSGDVVMAIQPDPPGFTATLTTYNGETETEFPLASDGPIKVGQSRRRLTGRYGDGQAQLTLDSFSGTARIAKAGDAGRICR